MSASDTGPNSVFSGFLRSSPREFEFFSLLLERGCFACLVLSVYEWLSVCDTLYSERAVKCACKKRKHWRVTCGRTCEAQCALCNRELSSFFIFSAFLRAAKARRKRSNRKHQTLCNNTTWRRTATRRSPTEGTSPRRYPYAAKPDFVQCTWMVLQDGQCGGLRRELCGETVLELRLRNEAMSCASMRSAHPKQ